MTQNDRVLGIVGNAAIKIPCRAVSTSNLTLSGEQTVAGVACVTGDRVLVKSQTDGTANGIYEVDTGAWERSQDFDGSYDLVQGTLVPVYRGTGTYAMYAVSNASPVIGTTSLTFDTVDDVALSALLAASSGSSLVGFIQSGTGAVAGTDQAELRRIWYPEQFGAVGDGVTDDAAAWALLLTAVGSSNFEIHGKPGSIYLLGAVGITVTSKTNGRIVANGAKLKFNAAATQTMGGFGSTMVKFDTCTNSGFVGWTIDGNSKATNAIGFTACTDSFTEYNYITAAGLQGSIVAINNTRNRYCFNTAASGNGTSRGLWIGNTAAGEQEIDGLIFGNVTRSNPGSGISGTMYGGRIQGNHSVSNGGAGIVQGGQVATGVIANGVCIVGNVCRSNAFHGIQMGDVTDWVDSTSDTYNLTVIGNQCHLNTHSGIQVSLCRDSTVSGNTCTDNVDSGILPGKAVRCTITGNTCFDTRAGGSRTQQVGIDLLAQVSALDTMGHVVTGNICYNNTFYGIRLNTAGSGTISDIVVSSNICRSNSATGIYIGGAGSGDISGISVIGNVCLGNTTSDMRIDPLDVVISGNKYLTLSGNNPTGAFTFTNADTTPSVKGREYFICTNSAPTTITNFTNGVPGQAIEILFTDANTTLTDGGNLKLAGGFVSTADDVMRLRFNGTNWYEVGRSVN